PFSNADGPLYAWSRQSNGDTAPRLYGVDRRTGAVLWRTRMASAANVSGPWGDGDFAYGAVVERSNWTLVAVDARTGARRWAAPLATFDAKRPDDAAEITDVVSVGGVVVAAVQDSAHDEQSRLMAVAAGAVRWRRQLLNPIIAASPDGRLFAASFDSRLHELDTATGSSLWSVDTSGPVDRLTVTPTMLITSMGRSTTGYRLPVR
ncbi:MAG TPA: PQQ-binding-like beta-propeller repeat protein, partial [Actinoplanes sp.]|nr:PQQ-binding-like beta-propeller repeat protein [Actinoplanes sp.]